MSCSFAACGHKALGYVGLRCGYCYNLPDKAAGAGKASLHQPIGKDHAFHH